MGPPLLSPRDGPGPGRRCLTRARSRSLALVLALRVVLVLAASVARAAAVLTPFRIGVSTTQVCPGCPRPSGNLYLEASVEL